MNENKPNSYEANEEIEIDLHQIIEVLKKWSRLIIAMTLLTSFSAGIISYFVLTPIYEAKTLLMVTKATDRIHAATANPNGGLENVVGAVSSIPVLTMQTYLEQLKSEALMKRIVDEMELDPKEYTPTRMAGMINASIVKDSNLIEVKVTGADPLLATRIANVLSREYLQLMTEKNQEQMSRSVDFLENQKRLTDEYMEQAAEELRSFQSQRRGVAVLEAEFNSKSQAVVDFENRLQIAQIELQQLQYGIAQLEQELSITPNSVLASANYNDGINLVQETNPLYITLAEKLAEKKAQFAEKTGEVQALSVLVNSMKEEIDYLQAELAEKRLIQEKLQSNLDILKKTSNTLAEKTTETQIAKSIDLGDTNIMVVSEASLPSSPIKPNKKLNVAIAAVLGFMVFTLLAFILEHLDNTIKTSDDVSRELGLPVLGIIPLVKSKNHD